MTKNPYPSDQLTSTEISAFEPIMKIGLLATVTPEGLPHITMLSSLKASDADTLTWGQFTEGMSFENVRNNPNIGWLVMTLNKDLWRGTGHFTHTATSGPDFDFYNNVPMFRYNAYFGIHTVYYMDLVGHTGKQPLSMGAVVLASIKTMIARPFLRKNGPQVMNAWTRALFNKLDNLKFLAYVGEDGYPIIFPVIQAQAAGSRHLIFSTGAFSDQIKAIPAGVPMALFGLCLDMTDVLTRGTYEGLRWVGPHRCGVLAVDWVYNPMPPVPQQIYPPVPLKPVRDF
ncbi:MAG: pyridoxamine 5'-phosphate oxidase family protein [Brevefilum sp.]